MEVYNRKNMTLKSMKKKILVMVVADVLVGSVTYTILRNSGVQCGFSPLGTNTFRKIRMKLKNVSKDSRL